MNRINESTQIINLHAETSSLYNCTAIIIGINALLIRFTILWPKCFCSGEPYRAHLPLDDIVNSQYYVQPNINNEIFRKKSTVYYWFAGLGFMRQIGRKGGVSM